MRVIYLTLALIALASFNPRSMALAADDMNAAGTTKMDDKSEPRQPEVDPYDKEGPTELLPEQADEGHRMCFNLVQHGDDGVMLKQYECSEDDHKDSTRGAKYWSKDGDKKEMSKEERDGWTAKHCSGHEFGTNDPRLKYEWDEKAGVCVAEFSLGEEWPERRQREDGGWENGPRNKEWEECDQDGCRALLDKLCPVHSGTAASTSDKDRSFTVSWREDGPGKPAYTDEKTGMHHPHQPERKIVCVKQGINFGEDFDKLDCADMGDDSTSGHHVPDWTRRFWIKSLDTSEGEYKVVCNRLEHNPENRHEHHGCDQKNREIRINGEHGSPSRCVKYFLSEQDHKMCDFRHDDGMMSTMGGHMPDEYKQVWFYENDDKSDLHVCYMLVDMHKECPEQFFSGKDYERNLGKCYRLAKGHEELCMRNAWKIEKKDKDHDGIMRDYCAKPRRYGEDCPKDWFSGGPRWSGNHCGNSKNLNMGDVRCRMNWHGDDREVCKNMVEKYDIWLDECNARTDLEHEKKDWHFYEREGWNKETAQKDFWKRYMDDEPPHCYFYGQTDDDQAANCWKVAGEVEHAREFMYLQKNGWCAMPAMKEHVPVQHHPAYEKDGKHYPAQDIPAHDKPACPKRYMAVPGKTEPENIFHMSKDGKECMWHADPAWRDATATTTDDKHRDDHK